ncbi:unnamed protein product [Cylicostephanus goldi]|uniref:Cation/H+ exchanger transmembrane domain-containing protein n=1 Tax=Cylicostephanus goldi TaxID=71465 RepID=A0A3P6TMI1_CYLGO|nr:unnamed protein product [Cylicostephanus goldi]
MAHCKEVLSRSVLVQCFLLNKFRGKRFTKVDQLILSYGGLRGAIAFGLAISIPETILAKRMFITTTLVVIFFTVFLQVFNLLIFYRSGEITTRIFKHLLIICSTHTQKFAEIQRRKTALKKPVLLQ